MNTLRTSVSLILVALLIPVLTSCQSGGAEFPVVTPDVALKQMQDDPNVVVLDVRSDEEYRSETGHLQNAILIPVDQLATRIGELEQYKDQQMLVYCHRGSRSRKAGELLQAKGFRVQMLDGGIVGWNSAGNPVVKEGE